MLNEMKQFLFCCWRNFFVHNVDTSQVNKLVLKSNIIEGELTCYQRFDNRGNQILLFIIEKRGGWIDYKHVTFFSGCNEEFTKRNMLRIFRVLK